MTSRPHTDLHKIVKEEVCAHMKPFIDVTLSEHETTRKEIKDAVEIMKLASSNRIHIILLWVFNAVMIGVVMVLHLK